MTDAGSRQLSTTYSRYWDDADELVISALGLGDAGQLKETDAWSGWRAIAGPWFKCRECGGPIERDQVLVIHGASWRTYTTHEGCTGVFGYFNRYTRPCDHCGRRFNTFEWKRRYCSYRCTNDAYIERRRARRLRARLKRCSVCARDFTATRSDGIYCSSTCRQKAYRGRHR